MDLLSEQVDQEDGSRRQRNDEQRAVNCIVAKRLIDPNDDQGQQEGGQTHGRHHAMGRRPRQFNC